MKILFLVLMPGASFLLLALYGAGIFPWTVTVATAALCLARWPWPERHHEPLDLPHGGRTCGEPEPFAGDGGCQRLWRSPFALLLLYLLIMLLPLPSSLSQAGDGARAQQNRLVVETLDAVTTTGVEHGVTPVFSLTRSRAGSLRFLLLAVLAYAGWSLAATSTARQRETGLRAVVIIGGMMAVAGILGKWVYPQGDSLWWWIPIPHGRPGPMGGFMNRNHFAGFCAILTPVTLALAAQDAFHRRPLAALLNVTAAGTLAAGVLLSLSRGGMVALAAGSATLLLIGWLRGRLLARLALAAGALLLCAAVLTAVWRHEAIRERVLSLRDPLATQSVQDRTDAWHGALRIWRQYPLLGAGPNAFRVVYPQHRTTSGRDARDFAENEYVQWLCEAGLAGLLIALSLACHLLRDACRALRTAPSGTRALAAAAIAALAAAAVHALVDFPMHLPLYALTVAALAGVLRGQTTDCRLQTADPCNPATLQPCSLATPSLKPAHLPLLACLVIALALGAFDLQLDVDGRIARASMPDTARALAAAPTSPVAWRRLAALLWQTGTPAARALAERCLTQAATYDPNNYPLWRRLGDMRRELGDNRGAMEAYRRVKALRSWVNVPTSLPEEN